MFVNGERRQRARTPNEGFFRIEGASPQDKPVKFKDLPVNAEFYFIADKDHKLFPRIKISSTTAKTVATPASPNVTTNPVPAETLVIMKKDDPKKDGEKKDPKAKKDGKQS